MEDDECKAQLIDNKKELVISLHTIVGTTSPQTMRIIGVTKGHGITVLLDSGNSHNFFNTSFAEAMGLPLRRIRGMKVKVANGRS